MAIRSDSASTTTTMIARGTALFGLRNKILLHWKQETATIDVRHWLAQPIARLLALCGSAQGPIAVAPKPPDSALLGGPRAWVRAFRPCRNCLRSMDRADACRTGAQRGQPAQRC